jgi:hypothetical protein
VAGLPESGYVAAARSGPRDVLEQFVPAQYDNGAPIDIQLAFDAGQLSGSVVDASGKGVDRAAVILVPDKARRHRPDQYRVVMSSADGKFSIAGIPPGSYKLFAWDAIEPNAWMNAEFMLNYEDFGTPLMVGASEKISAQIRVLPSP